MNWPLFAIACWLCASLQSGLTPLLTVGGRLPGEGAQFLMVLTSFVALCAPRAMQAVLAAGITGLLMDLQIEPAPGTPILGPMALGCMACAFLIGLLKKKSLSPSILSLVLATFVAGVLTHALACILLYARGVALPILPAEPLPHFSLPREGFRRFVDVVSTTALALPMGTVLMLSLPLWGMTGKQVERRFGQDG